MEVLHHQFPLRLPRLLFFLLLLTTTTTTTTTWGFVPTTTTTTTTRRTSPLLFSLQQELSLWKQQRQNEDWRNGKRFSVAVAASAPVPVNAPAKGARTTKGSSAKAPKKTITTTNKATSKAAKAPTQGAKRTKGSAKAPKKTITTNKATNKAAKAPTKGARKTKGSAAKAPKATANKATSETANALDTKTVPELRDMLRSLGLVVTGRKAQLVARLRDYYSTSTKAAATPASSPNRQPSATNEEIDIGRKTVPQLKELLRAAGLRVSGTKADLVGRLQDHYAQEEEEEEEEEPAAEASDHEDFVASLEEAPMVEANGQTPQSMPTTTLLKEEEEEEEEASMEANGQTPPTTTTTTLLKEEEEEEEPRMEANGQTPQPMPTTTTTTTATTLLKEEEEEEEEPSMEANGQSMPTTTTPLVQTETTTPEEPGWLWTVPMLKERCRELGLPVSGRKAVLVARLENAAPQTAAMRNGGAATSMDQATLGGGEMVAEEALTSTVHGEAASTPSFAEQERHRPVALDDLVVDPQYHWESLHTSNYATAYFLRDARYAPFRPEMVGNINLHDKGPRVFLEPRWIGDDRVAVLMGPAGSGKTIELAGSSVTRNADFAILPDVGPLLRRRRRRDDDDDNDLVRVLATFAQRYQKDLEAVYDLKAAQGASSLRIVVGIDDASKLSDLVHSIAAHHQDEAFQAQLVQTLFATRSGELDVKILFSVAGRTMSWVYTGTNTKSFDILRPLAVDYSNEAEAARRMYRV